MERLDTATITRRSIQGITALMSRTFLLNLVSIAASIIIFTFLSREDVGVFTAVIALQRIISFFTDFGLGAALVQKKDQLTNEDISTTFTVQASITFGFFVVVLLLNNQLMQFFSLSKDAIFLLDALVFTIFLSSFKTIPSILLERHIKFGRLVIPQIVESFVYNVVLILLLISGFKLMSFTWAFLLSSIISIPIYYFISPWPIRFGINSQSLSHLKFGTQFQAKNVLAAIKDDFLTVFLAKTLTFTELGFLGFGQRIAFMPYRYVVDSVTKVTFSTFSRIQEDKDLLKKSIEKSLFFVSLLIFPILVGIIVTIPYLIAYFPKWHSKWEPATLSVIFFSLNALVSSISGVLVTVLDSTGRVRTTLLLMILWTIATWILTPVLISMYGYNGAAIASFLVTLSIFLTVYLVKQVIPFRFLGSIYKPMVATGVMGIVTFFLAGAFVANLLHLILVILSGAMVYAICIYFLAKREISDDIRSYFFRYGKKA